MTDEGFTVDDVLARALNEPAFRSALDDCADDAGIRLDTVLDAHRQALVASGDHVDAVAACMAEHDRPMSIEHLPDGSANYGDLDRYFTSDTMDEFFDQFAECSDEPRDRFPTEAERDEAIRNQRDS